MDVECTVELGVATLSLARLNLTGTIQELRLGALAPSLTVLDLSGTTLKACRQEVLSPCAGRA